jgi:DNA segregation ATPase FtsK/SpoIIIE-like protein
LTAPPDGPRTALCETALEENARMLESVLDDYGVKGEIVSVRPGPVVTMYELEPAPGLKAARVIGLADDIARSMSALAARVSTVPGRSVIGIELPNQHREKVCPARDPGHARLRRRPHRLPLALGKDIGGDPVIANLAKMPHLLIAGTTGSGKSVAINTMILSLLYKLTPEECRMIMIDPKMLELSVYDGIPHLLSPVVTDPKKAVVALKWVVGEMEDRYRKMSKMGVRNIDGYNGRVADALNKGEMFSPHGADRLRRRDRRTGVRDRGIRAREDALHRRHRRRDGRPDDGRGQGDRGLHPASGADGPGVGHPHDHGHAAPLGRCHHRHDQGELPDADQLPGDVEGRQPHDPGRAWGPSSCWAWATCSTWPAAGGDHPRPRPLRQRRGGRGDRRPPEGFGPPDYVSSVLDGPDEDKESDIDAVLGLGGNTDGEDALYDQAVAIVIKDRKCSTSYIQRKLAIGYNKAARLVEQMEEQGVVSAANHVGKREILVP